MDMHVRGEGQCHRGLLHGKVAVVLLDSDLAELYGVTTTRLNQQVRRNRERFPADFMFRLTAREFKNLMSQFATSSSRWGGRRKLPLVFTEHGAVMAASVLNSPTAVAANIEVVRAFVRLRRILASHAELARKLEELARREAPRPGIAVARRRAQISAIPAHWNRSGRAGFRLASARRGLVTRRKMPSAPPSEFSRWPSKT